MILNAVSAQWGCRAEFIHGDGTRVKRSKLWRFAALSGWASLCAALLGAPQLPGTLHFCDCFTVTPGSHADWQKDLAKRMRRHRRWPHFMECRRKFCFARDRALHLVSGGARGPFEESFPKLRALRTKTGSQAAAVTFGLPCCALVRGTRARNFSRPNRARNMKQLRIFLADTIDLQADFLVERLARARCPKFSTPRHQRNVPESKSSSIGVASSAQGCYALVDYVNFKGEGVLDNGALSGTRLGIDAGADGNVGAPGRHGGERVCRRGRTRFAGAGGELATGTA